MLTLRVPASRRDRAAADLARCAGLSLVQSRRFGPLRLAGIGAESGGVDAFGSKGVA